MFMYNFVCPICGEKLVAPSIDRGDLLRLSGRTVVCPDCGGLLEIWPDGRLIDVLASLPELYFSGGGEKMARWKTFQIFYDGSSVDLDLVCLGVEDESDFIDWSDVPDVV